MRGTLQVPRQGSYQQRGENENPVQIDFVNPDQTDASWFTVCVLKTT